MTETAKRVRGPRDRTAERERARARAAERAGSGSGNVSRAVESPGRPVAGVFSIGLNLPTILLTLAVVGALVSLARALKDLAAATRAPLVFTGPKLMSDPPTSPVS